jgi:polyketide synthase PksN
MKFSPALNDRGITVGDDEVVLPAAPPRPAATPAYLPEPATASGELERLRARTAQLTALAI